MGNETTDQQQGSYYAPPSTMPPAGGPGYPPPGQFAPPPEPGGNKGAGKALAITALILAVVSLLLCWVPIVNNLVFFLGLLALGFGIPALIISVKKRSKAKGTSIAAVIIAVVALVGVLASQAMYSSMLDGISKSISDSADGVVDTAPKDQKKADDASLALGAIAKVGGDYEVAVMSVNPNAGDAIAAANPYNVPAKGQYVLVDISVKYVGAKEGNPWIDLTPKFAGGDARQYDTSTCMAALEKSGTSLPTLGTGATGDYQVCMDVPAGAVVDGKVFVEPMFSIKQDQRVYWNAK